MKNYALEAAAIALFESRVRADKINPTSWDFLLPAERHAWRVRVAGVMERDVMGRGDE